MALAFKALDGVLLGVAAADVPVLFVDVLFVLVMKLVWMLTYI